VTYMVRGARAGTESYAAEIRRAVSAVSGSLPITQMQTMQEVYDSSMSRTAFTLTLLALSGGMALLLAGIGIYAVIAYTVSQRTREIGIRLALGERPAAVRRTVVVDALRAIVMGLLPGVAAAWWIGRWLDTTGLVRADLNLSLAAVAMTFLLAGLLAAAGPAWRASRVDPIAALRAE